jgi:hypothetical protein
MSVTDDQGRVAQTCTIVQPGILPRERWEDGEPRLRFEFCSERPLVGLRVIFLRCQFRVRLCMSRE